jgi:hypothetical protein
MCALRPACGGLAQASRRRRGKICLEKTHAAVFVRPLSMHIDEEFIIDQIDPERPQRSAPALRCSKGTKKSP